MLIENVADRGGCPDCGVLSALIKDRPTSQAKDLGHGSVPLIVWVRKRRFLWASHRVISGALLAVRLSSTTWTDWPRGTLASIRLKDVNTSRAVWPFCQCFRTSCRCRGRSRGPGATLGGDDVPRCGVSRFALCSAVGVIMP